MDQVPDRRAFGWVRRRCESDTDFILCDIDAARRSEQVRDDHLRLSGSWQMRRDPLCKIGLDVGADDPDRIHDGLELAGVLDELPGELGLLGRRVLWDEGPHHLEMDPSIDRIGQILFDTWATFVDRLRVRILCDGKKLIDSSVLPVSGSTVNA
jgi:hypothetical protein